MRLSKRLAQPLCIALIATVLSTFVAALGAYFASRNLYLRAALWVYQSNVIKQDTGEILEISPKGEKFCSCAFGDGCSCSLALEVQGENGAGTFKLGSAFMNGFSTEFYFNIANWEWNGETTQIRRDGMTVEDYYAPAHYIEVLNDRIAAYASYTSYYERAQIQMSMNAPDLAYQDIQSAVSKFNEHRQRLRQRQFSMPQYGPLQDLLRVKAIIQSELKQYEQALATMEQVLTLGHEQDDNLKRLQRKRLERDFFLRWILQNEAGQTVLADQMLEADCGVGADLIFEPIIRSQQQTNSRTDSCRPLSSYIYEGYKLYRDGQYDQAKLRLQEDLDFYSTPRFNHETLLANLVLSRISAVPSK